MSGSVALAVSYGLLALFLVAAVVRSIRIARLPIHLRWELAPVPKERTRGRYGGSYLEQYEWWKHPREESATSELVYMLKEILFLKALWEHNRRLWWFSFPFHVGLYVLAAAAGAVVLGGFMGAVGVPGPGWGVIRSIVPWVAGIGYGLGVVGAVGLLGSRILNRGMRRMTTPVALFNLVLLLAVFGTGLWATLTVSGFGSHGAAWVRGLLTVNADVAVPAPLAIHLGVGLVFLAYLPFSQMMHFVAKYFTYHQVRWDDHPLEVGGAMEREVKELLQQPVSWAGPHVGADGRKNWVDVATEAVASQEVEK
ncbi:MAG: respiratory nitrate reductase subunit gamma [Gemmatimonadota bacterium]|jgi:nitrate reductase gamma subunit